MTDVAPIRVAGIGVGDATEAFLAERDLADTSRRVYRLTLRL